MNQALPPFAAPHAPEFARLLRRIERTEGFFVQPVESASATLAHAFADWLERQGTAVERCDLDAAGAGALLPFLTRARPEDERRVLLVIARSHLISDPTSSARRDLLAALAAVNFARDGLPPLPLVWWGDPDFLRLTWQHAPDLWSVAALTLRIPVRSFDEAWLASGSARWFTGAAATPRDTLEAALTDASTPAERARAGLRLVEALHCAHESGRATALLDALRPDVLQHAPALLPRWEALRAALSTPVRTFVALEQEAERVRVTGDHRREATLLVGLLDHPALDPRRAAALFWRALDLLRVQGDLRTAAGFAALHVGALGDLTPDDTRRLYAFVAATSLLTADPEVHAHLALLCAVLALHRNDLDAAAGHLRDASQRLGPRLAPEIALVHALLAARRGASPDLSRRAHELLTLAQAADLPRYEVWAHKLLADAHHEAGDFVAAAREDLVALQLARRVGLHPAIILFTLASHAYELGDLRRSVYFFARSVEAADQESGVLRQLVPPVPVSRQAPFRVAIEALAAFTGRDAEAKHQAARALRRQIERLEDPDHERPERWGPSELSPAERDPDL